MNWSELTSPSQLEELDKDSFTFPNGIAIFKHSTRCSISSTAKNRLERSWNLKNDDFPIFYLDLIKYREISNKIAEKYNIEHQSPQILIIKDGKCVYNASHFDINYSEIEKYIKNKS